MQLRHALLPVVGLIALCFGIAGVWNLVWASPSLATPATVMPVATLALGGMGAACIYAWRRANQLIGAPEMMIKAVCCLAALTTLVTATNQIARVYADPPPAVPVQATLHVQSNDIHLDEIVDFSTFDKLRATLIAHPTARRLVLNSNGGRIPAARGLARLVSDYGLATHVDETCASACTIVFIAGHQRTMGPNGRLGFHGYRLISTVETLNIVEEQDRDTADFTAQGVKQSFMERALAVPHDTMWFPTQAELRQAGVLTRFDPEAD